MRKLRVKAGLKQYPMLVGEGLLPQAGAILSGIGFRSAPVVVTNPTVMRLHGAPLIGSLEASFGRVESVVMGDGERFKSRSTLARIHDALFEARADRHSWMAAFGGGVVGDAAGFAAATYMRGIAVVHVPTTLLAQVDSAIGGKVGINVPQGKNLIGAFHQPSAILADTAVLRTLPPRELAAGLYEVVKDGAIRSGALLGYLEKNLDDILGLKAAALERIVLEAARIKAAVVAEDEREKNLRMILNFGHTIGHALEAATRYRRFKHGEAVAWGMMAALEFGLESRLSRARDCSRIERLIHRIERLPSTRGISFGSLWAALERDKKFRSGTFRMVLLPGIGRPEIRDDIDPRRLRQFLERFMRGARTNGA